MLEITLDLAKFDALVDSAKDKVQRFAVEVIQDVNDLVIQNTPVKTGFLRASWYAGLNDEPKSVGGAGDVAQLNVTASGLKIGDVYYAVNGANYAGFVEYGTSRMAPRAFVRTSVEQAPVIAERVAVKIASET